MEAVFFQILYHTIDIKEFRRKTMQMFKTFKNLNDRMIYGLCLSIIDI